jgi:hypothetical protein
MATVAILVEANLHSPDVSSVFQVRLRKKFSAESFQHNTDAGRKFRSASAIQLKPLGA